MKDWRSLALWVLRLGIAAVVLLWLSTSSSISWTILANLIHAWPITLAAIVVFAIDAVITACRLCVLLAPAGAHVSLYDSVRLAFMSIFFAAGLPGGAGGDAIRIYYASIGNRGRRAELATIVLLDRMTGLFAMFLWPVLAAPFFPQVLAAVPTIRTIVNAAALGAVMMLTGMLIVMSQRVTRSGALTWLFRNLPGGALLRRTLDTLHGYRRHPAALIGAVGISLIAHSLAIGVALLVAFAIDPAGFSWSISVLVPLGFIANAVPITPGGLGVGEAAFETLFRMAGLRGGAPVMIGWRVVMFIASLAGLFFYLQGKKRMVHVQSAAVYKESSVYESAT